MHTYSYLTSRAKINQLASQLASYIVEMLTYVLTIQLFRSRHISNIVYLLNPSTSTLCISSSYRFFISLDILELLKKFRGRLLQNCTGVQKFSYYDRLLPRIFYRRHRMNTIIIMVYKIKFRVLDGFLLANIFFVYHDVCTNKIQ